MKLKKLLSVLTLILVATFVYSQKKEGKDYSMYPKPMDGYEQKVISLKTLPNEENYKIEIFVGKNEKVDVCNNYFMIGEYEEKTLEGWGYNYYIVKSDGTVGGTLMGCLDNKKMNKLVYMPTFQEKYNSKLPVVVYVPKGFVVQYRIWSADKGLILVK